MAEVAEGAVFAVAAIFRSDRICIGKVGEDLENYFIWKMERGPGGRRSCPPSPRM